MKLNELIEALQKIEEKGTYDKDETVGLWCQQCEIVHNINGVEEDELGEIVIESVY